jgi:hypothetical protein
MSGEPGQDKRDQEEKELSHAEPAKLAEKNNMHEDRSKPKQGMSFGSMVFQSFIPFASAFCARETRFSTYFFPDGVTQAGASFDLSLNRIQEDRFDPPNL